MEKAIQQQQLAFQKKCAYHQFYGMTADLNNFKNILKPFPNIFFIFLV